MGDFILVRAPTQLVVDGIIRQIKGVKEVKVID
jgi:hypothetical protein